MVKIIDGKKLAEKVKDKIVKEIVALNQGQPEKLLIRPNLAIILVGEREDSKIYVALKERQAKEVGIDTHLYKCPENISEGELLEIIKCLNADELVDAILTQLPLPANIDTDTVVMSVASAKDVDGFHPDNLEKLLKSCNSDALMPPVFAAVLEMLKSLKYQIRNKAVCVVANADIFGQSLAYVLKCQGAKVETVKPEDKNLKAKTVQADVLITAAGQPRFIKKEMIKDQAVIIDIGINKVGEEVFGDVDLEDVKDRAGYISPVPGGVGPLTVAMAFKNTVEIYKRRHH